MFGRNHLAPKCETPLSRSDMRHLRHWARWDTPVTVLHESVGPKCRSQKCPKPGSPWAQTKLTKPDRLQRPRSFWAASRRAWCGTIECHGPLIHAAGRRSHTAPACMHASLRMHVYLCVHVSTHRHIPALSVAHRTGQLLSTKSSTSPPCGRDGCHRRMCLCASADPKPIVAPVHAAFLVLCVQRLALTHCLDSSRGARMRDTCVSRCPCERSGCLGDCWAAPAGRMWLQKELLWCLSKF